jgi:HEAT repeat protein
MHQASDRADVIVGGYELASDALVTGVEQRSASIAALAEQPDHHAPKLHANGLAIPTELGVDPAGP